MIIHVPFVFNQKSCHSEDFFLLFIFPYGHMLKLFPLVVAILDFRLIQITLPF